MTGRKRGADPAAVGVARRAEAARRREQLSTRRTRSSAQTQSEAPAPNIYKQLLRESGALPNPMTSDEPERPLKRPRTGRRSPGRAPEVQAAAEPSRAREEESTSGEDEEDIEFEDVDIPKPTLQTTYRDSSDDDSEEDVQFEDVEIGTLFSDEGQTKQNNGTLELNLTAAKEALAPARRNAGRRKAISKEEKEARFDVHKVHLLCLLAHVEKRNHWCNDPVVQQNLRPLLTAKIVYWLNPGSELTQFSQTESLKKGLQMLMQRFVQRFGITERGLRRSLWAQDEKQLEDYGLADDIDTCLEKADFRKSSSSLEGSRDVGSHLFCALLRAAGVETRLVCSLQPLSFATGGPTLPKRRPAAFSILPAQARVEVAQADPPPAASVPNPRARLGHPNATGYNIPDVSAPASSSRPQESMMQSHIAESEHPVYWVEVLDAAHQKWQPVDPFAPQNLFRANKFEPSALDRGNFLSYVVSFDEDGAAKDVTRRYAKAFNAKTRRMRIDGPMVSEEEKKWWRRALKRYRRPGYTTDLDQIENNELKGIEAKEPLPRNVIDFKNHPVYALQRHLRRHEVLVPGATMVGTVGAGSKGPLERIYRRKDVRAARSADKWYRTAGREIKPGEEPVKVLPKRKKPQRRRGGRRAFDESDESSSDDPVLGPSPDKGTPIYTFDQTQVYAAPPVVAGRVPKNRFGNLDAYVPSMIPAGGAHIVHQRAGRAAHVLGVDYAPALTGFDWRGRKGTAVYSGVIVPAEAAEAVRAVIAGFDDLEQMMEEERRSRVALATWKRLLRGLRIRKSVFSDEDMFDESIPLEDMVVDEDEGMYDAVSEQGAGGFEADYEQAGGFDPGGFEPGGFEPGGFEPGGFEPGGFEPGGFEPGGFEPDEIEDTTGGKGKEPETRGLDEQDAHETEYAGGVRRQRVRRARVLDSDEDSEGERLATATPVAYGQPELSGAHHDGPTLDAHDLVADRDEGNQPQLMDGISDSVAYPSNEDPQVTQPGGSDTVTGLVVADEAPGRPETPVSDANRELPRDRGPENGGLHDGNAQPLNLRADSEDAELEDAESDVTEELYMDEDGTLVE